MREPAHRKPGLLIGPETKVRCGNALEWYLRRISRIPPVTLERETSLGARIRAGRERALQALLDDEHANRHLAALLAEAGPGRGNCLIGDSASRTQRQRCRPSLHALWSKWRGFDDVLDRIERMLADRIERGGQFLCGDSSGADARAAVKVRAAVRAGRRCERSARAELVDGHLFLVVKIARKYAATGEDLLDLIQEGNIGLMRAGEKFDPMVGKFATYASWWIRAFVADAAPVQRTLIRLPTSVQAPRRRLARVAGRLAQTLGREPTTQELASELEARAEAVDALLLVPRTASSLDAPAGPGTTATLIDFIEDPSASSPHAQLVESERATLVSRALDLLTPREQSVLRLRFGLGGTAEKSLRQVADELGLSGERIRQLEREGLNKLKRSHLESALRTYAGPGDTDGSESASIP